MSSYGMDPGSSPYMGVGSWFVNAEGPEMGPTYTTFLFQLSFATTATTIVSGGIAERYLYLLFICKHLANENSVLKY